MSSFGWIDKHFFSPMDRFFKRMITWRVIIHYFWTRPITTLNIAIFSFQMISFNYRVVSKYIYKKKSFARIKRDSLVILPKKKKTHPIARIKKLTKYSRYQIADKFIHHQILS